MKEGFNMKRKFLSIVSLFLAVMMILPMGVFVSAAATDGIQIYHGTELVSGTTVTLKGENAFNSGETYELTVKNAAEGDVTWYSLDPSVASVDKRSGVVTLLKTGTTEVRVEDSAKNEASVTFDIELNECNGIRVADDYKKEYYSGQTFDVSSLTVYEVYKDGSEKKVTSGYSVEPSGKLTAADKSVRVNYGGKYSDPLPITVKEIAVSAVKIKYVKTEFTEGEKLPEIEVEVTYNDTSKVTIVDGYVVYVNDNPVSSSYTFKEGDNSIKVSYNDVPSDPIGIKVTKKSTDPVTDNSFKAVMTTAPTKKEYRVGDKFVENGMGIKIYQTVNGKDVDVSSKVVDKPSYPTYYITNDDLKNKTYITLNISVQIKLDNNTATYSIPLKVTGLTIKEAAGELDVYEITDVEMVENSYPVGYKFNLDDIDYFYYREKGRNTEYKVSGYDMLNSYKNDFDLEVLTNKNDKPTVKSSRYMYTLEEGDLFTDTKKDTQYAYLRLTVDKETYDFTVKVGGSGVYYYYDSDLIETYDDIDEAIKYTMEQDKNLKDFDLDKVKDSKDITLKLGEDQKVSTKTDFELCHNVTIDLAGHKLDFYTDTVDITKSNKEYSLTVTNTSSTSAKFTYVDEGVEITLAKGDKIVFEYDKDIPGIYTITLDIDTNGKVTTTPAAGKNDTVKVGQGSDVKFTITPSTDYELDTIKLDTKTVAEKDYTKSSTGVVTYTLKSVTKSQKVTVTFKKSNTAKNWNNPFTDVSATDSYYSAVKFVYENNLFKGTTTTKFGPDTTMTRAMFVTVLGRLAGVDVSRFKTSSYSDVPINATTTWYAPYVEWATQMGLVEGYGDGTFGPDNKITHQQMYVLMYKYSIFVENKKTNISGTSINASDAEEVADWAKDAVKYASQQNFLVKVGTSSRINPTGEAKRSELAQLLEKYCDVVLDWNSSNK